MNYEPEQRADTRLIMTWKQHIDDAYFRDDMTYAGKDHNKNNKTFIAISNLGDDKTGFRTLQAAMDYADEAWPEATLTTTPGNTRGGFTT